VPGNALRASHVVEMTTMGGAKTLGMEDVIGSITPGKKADLVLLKNDRSPAMFPIVHPYGHVVYQAGRGDVHTVLVDGKVVKHDGELLGVDLAKARRAVEETVEYARSQMGDEVWHEGMNPEIPEVKLIDNPYQYSEGATTASDLEK
jgi:5-methylthioadenosine/S-adenosylhomocysteine deaminase